METKHKLLINLNFLGYIAYIAIYVVLVNFFGTGNSISNYRYYTLLAITVLAFLTMFIQEKFKFKALHGKALHGKELLLAILVGAVFYLFSLKSAHDAGVALNLRTYVQISLFLLPALYAFCFINIFSVEQICKLLCITTVLLIIAYFMEPSHTIFEFFKIQNWLNINFSRFVSFTESSKYSESFLQLFLIFHYLGKKAKAANKIKIFRIFSAITFIFTILSFKRLAILFAIVILIFDLMFNKKIKIDVVFKRNYAIIFAVLFALLTVAYTKIVQGQWLTNFNVHRFTSARDYILSLWANQNYYSFGYGTSMLVIGRYLEMDLVQIYLELNIFAVFIFCYAFFKVGRKNIYSNLILIYAFLNMLTASSLPQQICWVIMLISISFMASDKCNFDDVLTDEGGKV